MKVEVSQYNDSKPTAFIHLTYMATKPFGFLSEKNSILNCPSWVVRHDELLKLRCKCEERTGLVGRGYGKMGQNLVRYEANHAFDSFSTWGLYRCVYDECMYESSVCL